MDWNPNGKYSYYVATIQNILDDDDDDRTVRDVYYALESRGFEDELRDASYEHALEKYRENPEENPHPDEVPEDEWRYDFAYRYVKRAVKKGRRAGYIDPDRIIDASRSAETTVTAGYDDPEDFIERKVDDIHETYSEDPWRDQSHYVEVWLEKQSLASVFAPICRKKNVRLEATRGDWSDSKVNKACSRLASMAAAGKDVRILYFGDFNPSGLHAPVAVQKTMQHYGTDIDREYDTDEAYFDIWPPGSPLGSESSDGTLQFERVALNLEHIEQYDLPENPTPSSTDKDQTLRERFMEHASDGRDVNIELNALKEFHRDDLEEMLEDAIDQYIDIEQWMDSLTTARNRREALGDAIRVDDEKLPE